MQKGSLHVTQKMPSVLGTLGVEEYDQIFSTQRFTTRCFVKVYYTRYTIADHHAVNNSVMTWLVIWNGPHVRFGLCTSVSRDMHTPIYGDGWQGSLTHSCTHTPCKFKPIAYKILHPVGHSFNPAIQNQQYNNWHTRQTRL